VEGKCAFTYVTSIQGNPRDYRHGKKYIQHPITKTNLNLTSGNVCFSVLQATKYDNANGLNANYSDIAKCLVKTTANEQT
jgi:hypothetical protein